MLRGVQQQFEISRCIFFKCSRNFTFICRHKPISNFLSPSDKARNFEALKLRPTPFPIRGYNEKFPPLSEEDEIYFQDDNDVPFTKQKEDKTFHIDLAIKKELEHLSLSEKRKLLHVVLERKFEDGNAEPIIKLITEAAHTINKENVTSFMSALKMTLSEQQGQVSSLSLYKNKDCSILFSKLLKLYPEMCTDELLLILFCFEKLGIDSESIYVKRLLQIIKFHMNSLSLKNIIQLNWTLRKMSNQDAKLLLFSLPFMAEKYLSNEDLSQLTFNELVILTGICIQNQVRDTYKVLEEIGLRGISSPYFALSIIWNIFDLPAFPLLKFLIPQKNEITVETLTKECLTVMARNITEYTQDNLSTTLRKAVKSFHRGNSFVYHEYFLQEVSKRAIEEDWDFNRLYAFALLQYNLRYINEEILCRIISECSNNSQSNRRVKMNILAPICCMDKIPQGLEKALDIIFQNQNANDLKFTSEDIASLWKVVECLSVGYIPEQFLEIVLNTENLHSNLRKRNWRYLDVRDILLINFVLSKNPSVSHLCLSESLKSHAFEVMLRKVETKHTDPSDVLKSIIKNPSHFVCKVHYNRELFIDKLVIVDEEGWPVTVLEESDSDHIGGFYSYDQLNVDKSHKRVAIINVPNVLIFNPGRKLNAYHKLLIKSLESEGFDVVTCLDLNSTNEREEELERDLLQLGVKLL